MKLKSEVTSPKIAKLAASILRSLSKYPDDLPMRAGIGKSVCTVAELQAICASALSQVPDKPKKK